MEKNIRDKKMNKTRKIKRKSFEYQSREKREGQKKMGREQ